MRSARQPGLQATFGLVAAGMARCLCSRKIRSKPAGLLLDPFSLESVARQLITAPSEMPQTPEPM